MLYVLYGSDTVRSQQKLSQIITEFRRKSGSGLTVYRFDAEEDDPYSIQAVLEAAPLFQEKKLVVVQHALRADKYKSLEIERFKDSKEVIIVLREWELTGVALKRLAEIKTLCSKIQELRLPEPAEKDNLIFELGDAFFASPIAARRKLYELLAVGQAEHQLFSYLANHCRKLLIIKAFRERREPIPAAFGIHPFIVKKSSTALRGISAAELQELLGRFFEEDLRIKTGLAASKDLLLRLIG